MACSNCPDFSLAIRSKAPYANRNDIVEMFNTMTDSCCVKEATSTFLNPSASDANAALMASEAFPDGADECFCPCKTIVDPVNDRYYINCNQDLNLATNWRELGGSCMGMLTTVALDPSLNAAGAVAEAFPLGLSIHCDNVLIIAEDGSQCWSNDNGASFDCRSFDSTIPKNLSYVTYTAAFGTVPGLIPTSVWTALPFNNLTDSAGIISSVVAGAITISSTGTYVLSSFIHSFRFTAAGNAQFRLRNVTQGVVASVGHAKAVGASVNWSFGEWAALPPCQFSANAGDVIQIEAWVNAGARFGNTESAVIAGVNQTELFAHAAFRRVA